MSQRPAGPSASSRPPNPPRPRRLFPNPTPSCRTDTEAPIRELPVINAGSTRDFQVRPPRPRPRPTPTPHHRWAPPLIAAGVLTLLIGGAALWPRAEPTHVAGINLAAAGRSAIGSTDLGALADPTRRSGCLRAVAASDPGRPSGNTPDQGPDAENAVLGGRQVELDGRPGVLLVVATGELGVFRVVVVDPACGPVGGTLLGDTTIGR
jgi:hypothetical protein